MRNVVSQSDESLRYRQLSDRGLLHFFTVHLDHAAFEEIVRRYERLVMSVCRRATSCREDAEDAFQATFIALAHRPAQLRKSDSLSSWLYSVAWRTSIRAHRLKRKVAMQTVSDEFPDAVEDPFLRIARDRDMAVLDEELNLLPEHYRSVLIMNFFTGQSAQQIADNLRTSKGVVDGRLQRAKNALRVRLVRRGVTMSAIGMAAAFVSESASAATPSLLQQTVASGLQVVQNSAAPSVDSSVRQLARPEAGGFNLPLVPAIVLSVLMCIGTAGWHQLGAQANASDGGHAVLDAVIEVRRSDDDGITPSAKVVADDAKTVVDKDVILEPKDEDADDLQKIAATSSEMELLNAEGKWGSVVGQIVLEGEVPERKVLHPKNAPIKDAAVCSAKVTFDDSLVVDPKTKGIQHCFVYLKKAPAEIHPQLKVPKVKTLVQDQIGCQFVPHTSFIQIGQSIETISTDRIAHNVHPFPLKNAPMSIVIPPASKPGNGIAYTPMRSETIPIPIRCDFHSWMQGFWLMLDHPYAAITDSEGRFHIPGLPEGLHELTIWHERVGYIDRRYKVIVRDGEITNRPPVKISVDRLVQD